MNESQALLAVLTGLFATGGIFGAKGLADRYISSRQNAQIAATAAEQKRQTTMAEATVAMAQRLAEAMIELAQETLRTTQTNILQLAAGLETHRTESTYQFQAIRQGVEEDTQGIKDLITDNSKALNTLTEEVRSVNNRLGVIVNHLSGNGAREAVSED